MANWGDRELKKLLLPPEDRVNLHFFRTVNVLLSPSHIYRVAITLWCSSVLSACQGKSESRGGVLWLLCSSREVGYMWRLCETDETRTVTTTVCNVINCFLFHCVAAKRHTSKSSCTLLPHSLTPLCGLIIK